jgi:hypothetical protein
VAVLIGAGLTCWGSILPWLTLKLFGMPIVLSGVVGLGSVTALLSLFALTRTRTFPLVNLVLGLLCALIGMQAQQFIGKTVTQQILGVRMRLAPVNARLEQVNLPPIEPFGDSISPHDYVGSGPGWVVWGGLAIAVGGVLQFAGGRLERTCAYCGIFWRPGRAIYFCSRCGKLAQAASRCTRCFTSLERQDRFCTNCGQAAPQRKSPIPEPEPPPLS